MPDLGKYAFEVLTAYAGSIAVLAVLSIVTLSIFAVRSIMAGRSTYYTIGACGAMSMFIFQTMLCRGIKIIPGL